MQSTVLLFLWGQEEDAKNQLYPLRYYGNNPVYADREVWANSVGPDQMLQTAASELGLHCLPLIQHYFRHINM